MKRSALLAGFLLALLSGLPAQAQSDGRDPAWRDAQQRREPRREQEPRHAEDPAGARRQGERLSREERQQLRRDIRQYGRDVYHDRSRRF